MSLVPYSSLKEPDEIVTMYEQRQRFYGRDIARMNLIQNLMNNKMTTPLPEISSEERTLIANLALRGMEQLSQRIASVDPIMHWPSTDPGRPRADDRATTRRRIVQGWHEESDQYHVRSKRARQYLSYASAPVVIKPDPYTFHPRWEIKNPIVSFPPPGTQDDLLPSDLITCDIYTYHDLISLFDRDTINEVSKPSSWNWNNDYHNYAVEFEVLEYIDEHEISLILVGFNTEGSYRSRQQSIHRHSVRLAYSPNLTGRPLVVRPSRICLDEELGHYDGILGMYEAQAAFMSLLVIAQRRAVWPREWIQGYPNDPEDPDISQDPDPYRGIPGIITHGQLNQQNIDPSFRALEIMDRQEDSIRKEAGVPSEMTGSSRTHISARRGAQVMGATIDFAIAEAQMIFARSLKEENKIAIAIDKAYFPTSKTFYLETRNYIGKIEYTPSDLWETDAHVVEYPMAGTDLQNLPIEGGQRVQMETMSREGFMEIDPIIKDVKAEIQRMDSEAIKRAFLTSIQALAGNPDPNVAMQPSHLMRLQAELESGTELYKAWDDLQKQIQEEQAAAQAAMAEQQQQLPGGAPELMPGMDSASAAQSAEAAGPIPAPPDSLSRFTQLLGSLGTAQQAGRFRQ